MDKININNYQDDLEYNKSLITKMTETLIIARIIIGSFLILTWYYYKDLNNTVVADFIVNISFLTYLAVVIPSNYLKGKKLFFITSILIVLMILEIYHTAYIEFSLILALLLVLKKLFNNSSLNLSKEK